MEKNTGRIESEQRSLVFDRMEDKTNVKDIFSSFVQMLKAIFGKQKDNQMLKDMNIKKGLLPGIRYMLFITFVLPFKVIAWVMTPRWEWVYFVRRHLVSPLFEVEAISGDDSPSNILGELYEKYLNFLDSSEKTGASDVSIKPEISRLERLMIFAKVRVIITLLFFAVFAAEIYTGVEAYIEDFSFLTSIFSGVAVSGGFKASGGDFIAGLVTMREVYLIMTILLTAFFSYIFIFAIRFVIESFKSVMYADSKMMKEFIDDTLHYTVSKAIELHGEQRAMDAYELLLENTVINRERYVKDEYLYKRLEKSCEQNKNIQEITEKVD